MIFVPYGVVPLNQPSLLGMQHHAFMFCWATTQSWKLLWSISHFIKPRLSSLSIKQRNRDWVTLSCKREEARTSNEMAHFHRNNIFLCLAYHFQIWKKWIYLSQGSLHNTALYTAQSPHGSVWQTFHMLHMPYEI